MAECVDAVQKETHSVVAASRSLADVCVCCVREGFAGIASYFSLKASVVLSCLCLILSFRLISSTVELKCFLMTCMRSCMCRREYAAFFALPGVDLLANVMLGYLM